MYNFFRSEIYLYKNQTIIETSYGGLCSKNKNMGNLLNLIVKKHINNNTQLHFRIAHSASNKRIQFYFKKCYHTSCLPCEWTVVANIK